MSVESFETTASGWQRREPFTVTVTKRDEDTLGIAFACLPGNQGIFIRDVRPGSAADRSGLLAIGDVITAVNSLPLTQPTRAQVEQVFATSGNVLELTIAGFVSPEAMDSYLESQGMAASDQSSGSMVGFCVSLLKAVLALPVLFSIFLLSVFEGFSRVVLWNTRKLLDSNLSDQRADPDNFLFDIMMAIWYGFVFPSSDYGFARRVRSHPEEEIAALTQESLPGGMTENLAAPSPQSTQVTSVSPASGWRSDADSR
ncbi:hypothetical protein PTSG_06166 [Salpingoeca rosetta]|uniref:PDZ domain-containing protein n=1 Tax=Salpingoeca rosetta (strain ATCC 50818 / BSB-021) TaxID=946362 RepID=F2UC50_SALR5|nr:uncharacterized protein PTSG_06166 [Salpingoeca rosetta]EGD74157.1 hypothetical protein PTSG_06166 [Salpingoeca rosetta]|eukprot:XP_004993058.1 hypothetical protein PTSG_06166 [Salpingoeca rosetta]